MPSISQLASNSSRGLKRSEFMICRNTVYYVAARVCDIVMSHLRSATGIAFFLIE